MSLIRIILSMSLLWAVTAPVQANELFPDERPPGLETVSFFSPELAREMKYDVVLPPDYHESTEQYPVLYLLHGYMQNYTVWGRSLGAAAIARELEDLILVMPDGGNSWYVDYAQSDAGERNHWESYLMEDLIPHVEENFRVLRQREGRAVAGLSMGGYGAVMLGLRHPGTFISVASTSGALSYARDRARAIEDGQSPRRTVAPRLPEDAADAAAAIAGIIDIQGFSTQAERTPSGIPFLSAEQARDHDPFQLLYTVPKSRLPHFHLDAGIQDNLMGDAREFMRILMFNDIPVSFRQGHGGHDAQYWRRAAEHFIPLQYGVMRRALESAR